MHPIDLRCHMSNVKVTIEKKNGKNLVNTIIQSLLFGAFC